MDGPPVTMSRYADESRKIATGEVTIKGRQHLTYRFKVEPEMYGAILIGEFKVAGANDIGAAVLTEDENANLISSKRANVLWSTEGKKTAGKCQRLLPPGELCLTFTNLYSASDKHIFLDFDLRWQRKIP